MPSLAGMSEDDEIDRDNEQFNQGVTHVVEMLAERIGAPPTWVAGDGSEDYDADLGTTLLNILAAKGLYNRDECTFAGQWQPIATAPTDGSHMILGHPTYVDSGYWDADGWTLYPDDTQPENHYCQRFHPEPTHWQPLPAAPIVLG